MFFDRFILISWIVVFLFLLLILKQYVKNELLFLLSFTGICLIIRSLMIYFKVPYVFYSGSLYDANLFANASSFYFSYLGDVLLNSGLIFLVSILLYKSNIKINLTHSVYRVVVPFVLLFVVIFFSIQIKLLIYSLVYNSTISYNINELFHFTAYSLIGLLSVGLLIFALYLFVEWSFVLFIKQAYSLNKMLLF